MNIFHTNLPLYPVILLLFIDLHTEKCYNQENALKISDRRSLKINFQDFHTRALLLQHDRAVAYLQRQAVQNADFTQERNGHKYGK